MYCMYFTQWADRTGLTKQTTKTSTLADGCRNNDVLPSRGAHLTVCLYVAYTSQCICVCLSHCMK